MLNNVYIPFRGYYSSPFSKWQGSFQNENSIELGAKTSKKWFESKNISLDTIDFLYLGLTIGQKSVFYGSTWAAHLMGIPEIPGMTVMQACSTSTTTIFNAAMAVELNNIDTAYCLMVDRCSNGPHTIWPNPQGPGGEVISENWNMDNMRADPSTGKGMLLTAETVMKEFNFTREQADDLALRRYEQYNEALANDRTFQKRYMFPIEIAISRKESKLIETDEGVFAKASKEGLSKLRPTIENGTLTFGAQTHPADGNVGVIVTTKEKALELSFDKNIPIQIISYGFARTKKGYMPTAPAPAALLALKRADLSVKDMVAIKNHNPFITNDLYLGKALGIDAYNINNYGSPLVFGHPQGPTMGRLLIEAIEETALKGGGYALVTGCAAGDTAAALIVKVG